MKQLSPQSIHALPPLERGGVEARQGFDVQDHVAAGYLITLLGDPALTQVWCETHDDITLIWRHAATEEVEFVQVKSNALDQLWSVAKLCERERSTANSTGHGTSILERSLANDRCSEPCSFRIVTCRPVQDDLKILTYPLGSEYRKSNPTTITALENTIGTRVGDYRSTSGHCHAFWLSGSEWDERHSLDSIANQNLLELRKLIERQEVVLFSDQIADLHASLLSTARDAAVADWRVNPSAKKLSRTTLIDWFHERLNCLSHSSASIFKAKAIEQQSDVLTHMREQTEQIPDINRKLDVVLSQLSQSASTTTRAGQLAVDARILDILAGGLPGILSTGLDGPGIRVVMKGPPDMHREGTLMIVWRLGSQSPHLMLADYVGGLHENRLSFLLNPDSSLSLRAYDRNGNQSVLRSPSHASSEYLIAFAVWRDREVSLWSNGKCDASIHMPNPFSAIGPVLLFGIDIEGTLSADACRTSPSEMRLGMTYLDYGGLNLQKDGISHGSRFDAQFVWNRRLASSDIHELTVRPYTLMMRSRTCDAAIRESSVAIESYPSDPGLFIQRAIAWTGKGNYRNAIADYSEAIRIDESVSDAFVLRGVAHNIIGNYPEAITDYQQAIRIAPRSTDAHTRLAWLLASHEEERYRNPCAALIHAQEAYRMASWRPGVLDTVAAAFAESGDFAEATRWQKNAVNMALEDEKLHFVCRLELYEKRIPFRDHFWHELIRVWRQSQMLGE